MTRGTTPTYIIRFKDDEIDFSLVDKFVVTFKQGRKSISKDDADIDPVEKTLTVTLSQEETLYLNPDYQNEGSCSLQVKGKFSDKTVFASNIISVPVHQILDEEVI